MATTKFSIRMKKDLLSIYTNPPPGVFCIVEENNVSRMHAIIVGPSGTPYEGGFFYLVIECPADYPLKPPKVTFMTTDAGRVTFNAHIFSSGYICLSILDGTHQGPSWSPIMSLSSVLLSIQSMLCEYPYYDEKEFHNENEDSKMYNKVLSHETLRVAVVGMLNNETGLQIPQTLRDMMEKSFVQNYNTYLHLASSKKHLDNQSLSQNNFQFITQGVYHGIMKFQYGELLQRLADLHSRLQAKWSDPQAPHSSAGN